MMLPWPASLQWLLAASLSVSIVAQVIPEGVRQIPVSILLLRRPGIDILLIRPS